MKAYSTLVLFLAEVSMYGMFPFSEQNLYNDIVETCLFSPSISTLLPTTMKGKVSGMFIMPLERNVCFQLARFSND
jgi:hypothetical protein